jgi:hypothetical protein
MVSMLAAAAALVVGVDGFLCLWVAAVLLFEGAVGDGLAGLVSVFGFAGVGILQRAGVGGRRVGNI